MQTRITALIAAAGMAASMLTPAHADQLQYYVWTDADGQVHATDTPPKDRDYQTHKIVFDPGTGSGASISSSPGSTPQQDSPAREDREAATRDPAESEQKASRAPLAGVADSGLGRALIAERLRRREQGRSPDPTGHTSPPGRDRLNGARRIPDIPELPDLLR